MKTSVVLRILLLVLLLVFFTNSMFSNGVEKTLVIRNASEPINLNKYTYTYSTKDTSSNVQSVINENFEYAPKGLKGINDNTIYWERFSFFNPTNNTLEYYIYFPYSIINRMVVYSVTTNGIEYIASLGMLYDRKDKVVESIGYPFLLKLKPGNTKVYIHIYHFNLALRTTSYLLTKNQLLESNAKSEGIIWLWKDFYLFATLIALILFVVTRLRIFGYYFILNIGVGLFFTAEMGEISKYFSSVPFNITANMKQTGVLIAFISLPLLLNQITPIAKLRPKLWRLLFYSTGVIAVSWLGCLIPYFLTNDFLLITTYLYNFYAPFFFLILIYFLYIAYKAKYKNAKFLFIGYTGYIIALFIYVILPNLGITAQNQAVYNTFIYGSFFETLMFMVVIGKETFNVFEQRSILLEEQKNHQAEIIRAIVKSQEKERNKVGRQLHDMIGANILVIKQQVDKSNRTLISIIDRTIESVRNLSHGLVTPLIKDDEFLNEINEICVLLSNLDIKIKSYFHNWQKIENVEVATHLYRIAQELLQNAVKHSGAQSVFIQFIINNEGELTLMYEDDGNGFDYEKEYSKGLGLINIDNRIQLINASIIYDTMYNRKGTTIIITVPLSSLEC